jgi:hypothetical protein
MIAPPDVAERVVVGSSSSVIGLCFCVTGLVDGQNWVLSVAGRSSHLRASGTTRLGSPGLWSVRIKPVKHFPRPARRRKGWPFMDHDQVTVGIRRSSQVASHLGGAGVVVLHRGGLFTHPLAVFLPRSS